MTEIIKIKSGFTKEAINYGWVGSDLYRLPSAKNGKVYPLLKLHSIKVGNGNGYNIARKKLSVNQCLALTVKFKKAKEYFV